MRVAQRLTIPGYLPPSLNMLLRAHWSVRHKLNNEAHDLVYACSREAGLELAQGKRKVSLKLQSTAKGKVADTDNVLKLLLDALVKAGLLVDDSPRWVEIGSVEWTRGTTRQTEIVLEDVP